MSIILFICLLWIKECLIQLNNVVPRAALEKSDPNTSHVYSRDPNRYNIQKDLYEGGINSFDNVSRNLRM